MSLNRKDEEFLKFQKLMNTTYADEYVVYIIKDDKREIIVHEKTEGAMWKKLDELVKKGVITKNVPVGFAVGKEHCVPMGAYLFEFI